MLLFVAAFELGIFKAGILHGFGTRERGAWLCCDKLHFEICGWVKRACVVTHNDNGAALISSKKTSISMALCFVV